MSPVLAVAFASFAAGVSLASAVVLARLGNRTWFVFATVSFVFSAYVALVWAARLGR